MDSAEKAVEILDALLGFLGYVTEIFVERDEGGVCLQIYAEQAETLIGPQGKRLEDLQFLLNLLLRRSALDVEPVRVDVEHFRDMQQDNLTERVQRLAQRVRKTGRPVHLAPMNSYFRRIVHQAFVDDPLVKSTSPEGKSRLKRITLHRREKKS